MKTSLKLQNMRQEINITIGSDTQLRRLWNMWLQKHFVHFNKALNKLIAMEQKCKSDVRK